MAKQAESRLQRRIRKKLEKEVGGVWRKIHGGPFQAAGILDLVGCVRGLYFEIEVKTPKGRPSSLQLETIKELKKVGACTGIVTSPEEAISLVQEHLKKNSTPVVSTSAIAKTRSPVLRRKSNRRVILPAKTRKDLDSTRRHRSH